MFCFFRKLLNYFPERLHHFTISPASVRDPISLQPHQHIALSLFFIIALLIDVVSHSVFSLHFPNG